MKPSKQHRTIEAITNERNQWERRANDLEIERDHLLEVANKFISMCDIYFINGDFTKDTTNQVLELRALAMTAVSRVSK